MPPHGLRFCSGCLEYLPLAMFGVRKDSKDGLQRKCRRCRNAVLRAYSLEYLKNPDVQRRKRENDTRGYRGTPRASLRKALYHAVRRFPTEVSVTIGELMNMWDDQDGRCALSHIRMTWSDGRQNHKPLPTAISLDRIDQTKGYMLSNVRLLCHCVNSFRGRMSDDEMCQILIRLYENMVGSASAAA